MSNILVQYVTHAPEHPATCSERLRDFYLRKLKPRGVSLELVLADVYKATWEEELHPSEVERRVYATKVESAREGMRMLLSQGIRMRAMRQQDWAFLVSQCDPDVQAAYARRGREGSPFTRLHLGLRHAMDAYLSGYIHADWRGGTLAAPSAAAASKVEPAASYRSGSHADPSRDIDKLIERVQSTEDVAGRFSKTLASQRAVERGAR